MEAEFVLAGLFHHLVRRGFPLQVRDYQEVLLALRQGHGRYRRRDLQWLCETLWARTEEEVRQIDILFREMPEPTPEEIDGWAGKRGKARPQGRSQKNSLPKEKDQLATATSEDQRLAMQFVPTTQTGRGLPQAQVQPFPGESFVLETRPVISARTLIVMWRRFRRALRSGPGVELDIQQTIQQQCRLGRLAEPALLPARRNEARLLVLVDASPSMEPWRSFFPILTESLRESQLGAAHLYYFHNVPDVVVYEQATLTQPMMLRDLMQHQADRPLLILSDSGAARGVRSWQRLNDTVRFLTSVRECWRPVVWVNPMPRHRWQGSTAEQVSRLPQLTMTELTEDELVRAVDVLRGQRNEMKRNE